MKDHSGAVLQFSGYPLYLTEPKKKIKSKSELSIVRPQVFHPTTFIQLNAITNDPSNWDHSWFCSYE